MNPTNGKFVPNFFYDVIVFLTPTITLSVGFVFGTGYWRTLSTSADKAGIGLLSTTIGFILLFFAAYEYGRFAEALSSPFVAGPIRLLKKRTRWISDDFSLSMKKQVDLLDIDNEKFFGRAGDKWTLFFYAQAFFPRLGADLMKRYAWEKLSRSSAFTFQLLFCVSVFKLLAYQISLQSETGTPSYFEFGGIGFTIFTGCMYLSLSYEYYRRNCWNNDLLIKTVPVVVEARANDVEQDEVSVIEIVSQLIDGQEAESGE